MSDVDKIISYESYYDDDSNLVEIKGECGIGSFFIFLHPYARGDFKRILQLILENPSQLERATDTALRRATTKS